MKAGRLIYRFACLLLSGLMILTTSSQALTAAAETGTIFSVNATFDDADYLPGDGICATAPPVNRCTLRAATMEANTLPGDNTILLPAGTYTLTQIGADEDASSTGDLDITESLSILGDETGNTIIDGYASDRVIEVLPTAARVFISWLWIQNGHTT